MADNFWDAMVEVLNTPLFKYTKDPEPVKIYIEHKHVHIHLGKEEITPDDQRYEEVVKRLFLELPKTFQK